MPAYHQDQTGGIMKLSKTMLLVLVFLIMGCYGCNPTVTVAPPDKPITINLNVKIQHEILVKVDKELDDVLSEESGLF
jgi:hypothetical protein